MNPAPEEFRSGLRAWLGSNLDPALQDSFTADQRKRITAELYDQGYLHVTWPAQYGGQGLGAEYQTIFNEEIASYRWAVTDSLVTVGICAATLLDHGSEEQKLAHLRNMLRGDEEWTQLLSEPGAGSDLGGIITRAVLDGETLVVNGQKVWTSGAASSDYAIALVRTDPAVRKYDGLSMVLLDMSAPGIDVRPLKQMTGDSHFNEVFLEDVRVPVTSLVGGLNSGWSVLSTMLTHERVALSAGTAGSRMDRDTFAELLDLARRRGVDRDPTVRRVLADLYTDQRLLDLMGRRMRAAASAGLPMGPVGSIGKIVMAHSARLSAEATILVGDYAALARRPGDAELDRLMHTFLYFPMTAIAGGTTEIQKNIVAERLLGLPREDHPNRTLPFNQTITNQRS